MSSGASTMSYSGKWRTGWGINTGSRIKPLDAEVVPAPEPGKAKTWLVYGRNERGEPSEKTCNGLSQARRLSSVGAIRRSIHTSNG
jgi:hypothetical protein